MLIPSFIIQMISKELVRTLAQERIDELNNGLFIVDIAISPAMSIQLEIDKENGNVAIEDCVSVSRNVEHNLDREEQDFELHVSSAGIDRPLRVFKQYVKNIGRSVELVLKSGTKKEGKLVAATTEALTIEFEKKVAIEGKKKKELIVEQESIPMTDIKETKIVISFK